MSEKTNMEAKMEEQMKILEKKLEDQKGLQNILSETFTQKMFEVISKFKEQKTHEIHYLDEQKSIEINKATAAALKKLNADLMINFKERSANDATNDKLVDQNVLDFIDGKKILQKVDLYLIEEYQNLRQLVKNTKTRKQIQEEVDGEYLETNRLIAETTKLQTTMGEKKRRIVEKDFPAFREATHIKKQIQCLKQQSDELEKSQRDNQIQMEVAKDKRDRLTAELKKKQQLKAMEQNIPTFSSVVQNFTSEN